MMTSDKKEKIPFPRNRNTLKVHTDGNKQIPLSYYTQFREAKITGTDDLVVSADLNK